MAVLPVVRYMLLCDDYRVDGPTRRRVTIIGLLGSIVSTGRPAFPLFYRELCVFLLLTDGRGQGDAEIRCTSEDTGVTVFATGPCRIRFPANPLDVVGVPFRIRDCEFPHAGRYTVQFWFEGGLVEERPLQLR